MSVLRVFSSTDIGAQTTFDETPLPYSHDCIQEKVKLYYGKRTIKIESDSTISFLEQVKDRKKCFLLFSKKDYYLYVYEVVGQDTILRARYDCTFALRKGDKTKQGDMRTPHCVSMSKPFHVSEIKNSSAWRLDFGDGRGSIKSYGNCFIRLQLNGHRVVNNPPLVFMVQPIMKILLLVEPVRGCTRLKDKDIKDLRENYVIVGMKVYIKSEEQDDLIFERKSMRQQYISKRHLEFLKTLSNEKIVTHHFKFNYTFDTHILLLISRSKVWL